RCSRKPARRPPTRRARTRPPAGTWASSTASKSLKRLKCFDPSGPPGPEGVFPERLPRVRVWDAPTRLFHWTLAAAFAGEWLTRDARYIDLHEFLGYAI